MSWDFFDRLFGFVRKDSIELASLQDDDINEKLKTLEEVLEFPIRNKSLYIKSLAHRSYLELHPDIEKSNERLEFLGDSVLSVIVANYLFENYPDEGEGFLTKARASLVNRENLSSVAEDIGLENLILYNKKYIRDYVYGLKSITADALEALIGAIFLDKGLSAAEEFINKKIIKTTVDDLFFVDTNYKGQLLETAHARRLPPPRYRIKDEVGPPHKKLFTIEVYFGEELYGVGLGSNKKSAEQEASREALKKLDSES